MSEDEHNWLLNLILALMDPFYPEGARSPIGHVFDLETNWFNMETASINEARALIEKMGFVRTVSSHYCHPEDLAGIDRAINDAIDKERNTHVT